MFGTRDAQTVLSYYALGQAAVRQIEPVGNAGGWSGSRLWRLGDASGRELCLRRWPAEHPTADRLRLIHGVLRLVFDELPIIANPLPSASGSTFIEHAGHLWELTPWRPGRADYPAQPNRARLRAAVQSLARFHDLAARYKQCLGAPQTILDRQQRWKELQQSGLSAIERSLATPLGNEIDQRATRLLALAHKALESSQAIQSLSAGPELSLQPAIRDIHPDHVLFTCA